MEPLLTMTFKLTTLVEVESPSYSNPPINIEVIDEIPFPHFNPPLLDTLDFVL